MRYLPQEAFVANTDRGWFDFLASRAAGGRLDEVNFWLPRATAPGGFMDDAIFVEGPRVVVIWSSHQGSEGCDASDPSYVDLIPVNTP